MTESDFKRLEAQSRAIDGPYAEGYHRGLRRGYYGDRYGTAEEHRRMMALEDMGDLTRAQRRAGYLDGLEGRPPTPPADGGCGYPGCNRPVERHGICRGHRAMVDQGRPLAPLRARAPDGQRRAEVMIRVSSETRAELVRRALSGGSTIDGVIAGLLER